MSFEVAFAPLGGFAVTLQPADSFVSPASTFPLDIEVAAPIPLSIVLGAPGPQGERGLPGSGGGSGGAGFEYTQSTPSTLWTVAHNLGYRPTVTVCDHLGNVVLADVHHADNNILQVSFGSAFIGSVQCS